MEIEDSPMTIKATYSARWVVPGPQHHRPSLFAKWYAQTWCAIDGHRQLERLVALMEAESNARRAHVAWSCGDHQAAFDMMERAYWGIREA